MHTLLVDAGLYTNRKEEHNINLLSNLHTVPYLHEIPVGYCTDITVLGYEIQNTKAPYSTVVNSIFIKSSSIIIFRHKKNNVKLYVQLCARTTVYTVVYLSVCFISYYA